MKQLQRYLLVEIVRVVLFTLIFFLTVFAFFDLMSELSVVGYGGYQWHHALWLVLLRLPKIAYELMPIVVLIGTIYTLAQFAARSEFTVMRASGLSTWMVVRMLMNIGILFVIATFCMGEFVAPKTARIAQQLKWWTRGGTSQPLTFVSGLWGRDVVRTFNDGGEVGQVIGTRFINIEKISLSGDLTGILFFDFDPTLQLMAITTAASAVYHPPKEGARQTNAPSTAGIWELKAGKQRYFHENSVSTNAFVTQKFTSEMTPEVLSVVSADPDDLSFQHLYAYVQYLKKNKQRTKRYEIAFWKKVLYPFSVFVMMAVALPFAYFHFRSGEVGFKIFIGIMLGVSFQLVNILFSHMGLLNTWPSFVTAAMPSGFFLLLAIASMRWILRY